jgi:hypothetical protein
MAGPGSQPNGQSEVKHMLMMMGMVASAATFGMLAFVALDPQQATGNDGLISFDLDCISDHLATKRANSNMVEDCQVEMQGSVLGKVLARFVQPATPAVRSSRASPSVMSAEFFGQRPRDPTRGRGLEPGKNYASTKNMQIQSSGFGQFVQKFQLATGNSKYGMPIYLPNGAVNPAYLKAEAEDIKTSSRRNVENVNKVRASQYAKKKFELGDYMKMMLGRNEGYQNTLGGRGGGGSSKDPTRAK